MSGTDTVVHCASGFRRDVDAARNLIEAARRAGVSHLVYISIVGVDRIPFSYYRAKLEVERLIEASGLPWTVLRTTQFHDLLLSMARVVARPPVMLVPAGTSFQPIDVREVAGRLADLAVAAPAGRVPDIGGPKVVSVADLARAYLRARGRRRPVVPVRLPGAVFAGFRRGDHLAPDWAVGRTTFEEFLAERIAAGSRSDAGRRSKGR